jgi:hypothetical protein
MALAEPSPEGERIGSGGMSPADLVRKCTESTEDKQHFDSARGIIPGAHISPRRDHNASGSCAVGIVAAIAGAFGRDHLVSGSPDSMQYHVLPCQCGISATERWVNSLLASAAPSA